MAGGKTEKRVHPKNRKEKAIGDTVATETSYKETRRTQEVRESKGGTRTDGDYWYLFFSVSFLSSFPRLFSFYHNSPILSLFSSSFAFSFRRPGLGPSRSDIVVCTNSEGMKTEILETSVAALWPPLSPDLQGAGDGHCGACCSTPPRKIQRMRAVSVQIHAASVTKRGRTVT